MQKEVVIEMDNFIGLNRFVKKHPRKKLYIRVVFTSTRQAIAAATLYAHPISAKGMATKLYGNTTHKYIDRAGAVLRRLRNKGVAIKDANNIWSLRK